eukprot:tig00020693_g13015.t1
MKVSKDVQRLRDYEASLLAAYQRFLQTLDALAKDAELGPRRGKAPGARAQAAGRARMGRLAVKCMGELLVSAPHFNFRSNLVTGLAQRCDSPVPEVRNTACEALGRLFQRDAEGGASLEAVRALQGAMERKGYRLRSPDAVALLKRLHLKQQGPANWWKKGAAGGRKDGGGKRKEVSPEEAEAERQLREDMAEADATADPETVARNNSEMLKAVFVIYFSILKNPAVRPPAPRPAPASSPAAGRPLAHAVRAPLLGPVLEGIAKFAHLVNIELLLALLDALKVCHDFRGLGRAPSPPPDAPARPAQELVAAGSQREGAEGPAAARGPPLAPYHALLCILAAFRTLAGQGEALNVDLKEYYRELYALLMPLAWLPSGAHGVGGTPRTLGEDPSDGEGEEGEGGPGAREGGRRRRRRAPAAGQQAGPSSGAEGYMDRALRAALEALEVCLLDRRQVDLTRAAGFVKRLCTLALHVHPPEAVALLSLVQELLFKYPKAQQLLDSDHPVAAGVYLPQVDDPEHSNPFSSTLWELSALQRHYHPYVARFAALVANSQRPPAHLASKRPRDYIGMLDVERDRAPGSGEAPPLFQPPLQPPRQHPLHARIAKNASAKKGKGKAPFVTPAAHVDPRRPHVEEVASLADALDAGACAGSSPAPPASSISSAGSLARPCPSLPAGGGEVAREAGAALRRQFREAAAFREHAQVRAQREMRRMAALLRRYNAQQADRERREAAEAAERVRREAEAEAKAEAARRAAEAPKAAGAASKRKGAPGPAPAAAAAAPVAAKQQQQRAAAAVAAPAGAPTKQRKGQQKGKG